MAITINRSNPEGCAPSLSPYVEWELCPVSSFDSFQYAYLEIMIVIRSPARRPPCRRSRKMSRVLLPTR